MEVESFLKFSFLHDNNIAFQFGNFKLVVLM
jgi:hypothetical protein